MNTLVGAIRKVLKSLLDLAGLDSGRTVWGKRGLPESGYTMFPHDWHDDVYRVTVGQHLQLALISYAWRLTAGVCGKDDQVQEWTPWVPIRALVEKFGCDTADSIHDALENGKLRGLWLCEHRRGEVRIFLLPSNWPKMKHCKSCSKVHVSSLPCIGPRAVREKKPQVLKPLEGVRYGKPVTFEKGREHEFTLDRPSDRLRLLFREGDNGMAARLGVDPQGLPAIEFWQEKTETKDLAPIVSGVQSRNTAAKRAAPAADPVIQEIAAVIGTYGPVTIPRIVKMVADCNVPAEKVLHSLSAIQVPETANDPVAWILAMVPRYHSGAYKPATGEKKKSAREQLADEIWGSGRRKRA